MASKLNWTKSEVVYLDKVRMKKPIDRLIHWITRREKARINKEAGEPKPFCDDPIIQKFYFTNVNRENDRVTVWVRENLRTIKPSPKLFFAIAAFRWFNYIPTGEALIKVKSTTDGKPFNLIERWNPKLVKSTLNAIKSSGGQVFTGAFNISAGGSTKPKIDRVVDDYIQPLYDDCIELSDRISDSRSLEKSHKMLMKYPGLGGSGFMAAQIICDLKYTPLLEHATDWYTWASPGPGSKKGLNILLERPIDTQHKNFLVDLNRFRDDVNRQTSIDELHAMDFQNCLCEMSKYENALWGTGHMKRRYQGV